MFDFFKKISCVIKGHFWIKLGVSIEEEKIDTFRSTSGKDVQYYRAKPIYKEHKFNVYECKHCKTMVKADLTVEPNNSRRIRWNAIWRWDSWVLLIKYIRNGQG